jgi:RimJ/RimL family protein N-acetyltransferase
MSAATHLLTLPGGPRVGTRPIAADDKPGLLDFFRGMSAESRRRRFLSPKPKLTANDLRFLTEVDQHDHVAMVAVDPAGKIVAVGRYSAWAGQPGRAEIAFAVVDALHGRGLGTALGRRLVGHARAAGVRTLTGSTLNENRPARALLATLGFRPLRSSYGVVEYELEL